MNIHESAEDYLERILMLRLKNGMVRSIDIVRELDYSKPSVSVAMKQSGRQQSIGICCFKVMLAATIIVDSLYDMKDSRIFVVHFECIRI